MEFSTRLVWLLISGFNSILWGGIVYLIFKSWMITIPVILLVFIFTLIIGSFCVVAGNAEKIDKINRN